MAIVTQPNLIPEAFANSGSKNVIPDTMPTPTAGAAASWSQGFPSVTSLPLSAGGIAPAREDFNGIFNALSSHTAFQQSGGVYAWNASLDYDAGAFVVASNGSFYRSLEQNGPNTIAGVQNPVTARAYWITIPSLAEIGSPIPAANEIPRSGNSGLLAAEWLPYASEVVRGSVELATNAEAVYGTDTVRVITPAHLSLLLPPGALLFLSGNPATVPSGFIPARGGTLSRTTYSRLFAAIGTTYGAGDGYTTFGVPNYDNRFLQPNATAGTPIDAGLPNIHGVLYTRSTMNYENSFIASNGAFGLFDVELGGEHGAFYTDERFGKGKQGCSFSAHEFNPIYNESTTVQPPAMTVRVYIKY